MGKGKWVFLFVKVVVPVRVAEGLIEKKARGSGSFQPTVAPIACPQGVWDGVCECVSVCL